MENQATTKSKMICPGCQQEVTPKPIYYFGDLLETICPECYTQCEDFRQMSWVLPVLLVLVMLWLLWYF